MREYQVTSKLLEAAIWGGTGCYQWDGYTNADKGNYGRALLEYFASRLFSIHRFPGYEPFYTQGSQINTMCKFGGLSEEEIEGAYHEFKELYYFTQNELKENGIVIDGKVQLNRSLRSFETDEILPQILEHKEEIEFPANIITSYAHDERLYDYGRWMSVVRDVPVELILIYDECLAHIPDKCAHLLHGGESEVFVVEKNIFGYIKLPAECFKYEQIPPDELYKAKQKQLKFCHDKKVDTKSGSLFSSETIDILPCKNNKIVEFLVSMEAQKIKKQFKGRVR